MKSVRFGHRVRSADWDGEKFRVATSQGVHFGRVLVVGTGPPRGYRPAPERLLGTRVFHVSEYLTAPRDTSGRRVLVVGGGQSGAEVVRHLLTAPGELPGELTWVLGRDGIFRWTTRPSPTTGSRLAAVRYFNERSGKERDRLLDAQHYASDGVSEDLAAQIYRRLYELDYLERPSRICSGTRCCPGPGSPGWRNEETGRTWRACPVRLTGSEC